MPLSDGRDNFCGTTEGQLIGESLSLFEAPVILVFISFVYRDELLTD